MIRRLAWRLGAERRNRGWKPHYRELQRVVALSPEAFREWQAERVRAHLTWAREAVPFFRNLPADADALEAFPILTRGDVQAHVDALCDSTRPRSELIQNASGGSTGEPVVVYQDREYGLREFATENWIWFWWGLTPWCSKAYLWGDDLNPEDHTWKARLEARLLGETSLNVFDLDRPKIEAFVELLERRRPDVILGYASALELFAAYLRERGGLGYRPKLLRSAAEAVDAGRRGRIEAGFGRRLTDYYGSRESASLAAQWHDGHYYVFAHGRVIEIVDDAGRAVPPGVPGRVLVTDFTNRAFGLIRYENGDIASWAEPPEPGEDVPCPFPRLERIHGRTSDFITTPEGGSIHGEFFTHVFYGVPEVTRFQIRQEVVERLEVLTVGSANAAIMLPLIEKIRAQVGPKVEVVWSNVEEIPLTRTGKHRYTVSRVPFPGRDLVSSEPNPERRVLLLIDEYQGEDGGTEGQVATLLRGLPAPWKPRIWALRNAPYFEDGTLPCPTRVIELPSIKNPLFVRRLRRLAREIRDEGVELVHAFMADGALYGPLVAQWAGVPVITSRRDLGYWQTPRKLDLLRIANRSADLVLANASAVAERTVEVEWVSPSRVAVVGNGHDPARFEVAAHPTLRDELGVGPDARLVGLLANFRPLKRQADLVEALAQLGEGTDDVHVLFLGEYDDAEVRERAEALGVASRVHVLRPGPAVVPILKQLAVGVLCSESEGLSNAILEYMACGLPVVASAVGGTPDLVTDGESGHLYPAGDVPALTKALHAVLDDPDHAARLGQAGRARFVSRYTAERMIADTVACYERVLASRAPPATEDLTVEVVESLDDLRALGVAWDALLGEDQFFLSPTWALTWLDVAEGVAPCVPVVRDAAGDLAGLVPLCRTGKTVAFCGRALGADHLDVVSRPGLEDAVARLALDALRARGIRRASLHHVTEDGALRRALHDPTAEQAFTEYCATVAHYARPDTDFDAYLAERYSRNARNRFRRSLKKFEARDGATVEVITTTADAERLLQRVFAIHGSTLDEASTFATGIQRAFHAALIPSLAEEGRLFAGILSAEGKDLAVEYGFRFQGRIYGYQSGMAPDEATPSPGTLLLYLTLRDHVFPENAGVVEYDFLDGDEAYKRRWKSGTRRLYDVEVDLGRKRGGMRGFVAALRTMLKEEVKRRLRRDAES